MERSGERSGASVVIDRATVADADAVTALVQRAYERYLPRMSIRPRPMEADYRQVLEERECWAARSGADLAGVLVLGPEERSLLLENIAVDPARQGQGIGGRLLDLAEQRARELGLPVVRLYTHVTMVENQQLYAARGYVETHRATEAGREAVFYELTLG